VHVALTPRCLQKLTAALVLCCLAGCAGHSRSTLATMALPRANLAHLQHLSEPVTVADRDALAVWIYAEAPDYHHVTDDDEGFSCVDDVARFVVVVLLHARRTGSKEAEELARGGLAFVMAMQADDGQFYNFIFPDRSINRTGHTSFKDHGWWASRALWALGSATRFFARKDPELAARCRAAAHRLLPWYDGYLEAYGTFADEDGGKLPRWLLKGRGDVTSEAVLGMLELYQAKPDPKLGSTIAQLCDGLAAFQVTDPRKAMFGAHPSSTAEPELWHHWGSRQSMALARAFRVLPNHENSLSWLKSAVLEADKFFEPMLYSHVPENIRAGVTKPYPQIAYGLNSLILGFLEIYRASGEDRYLQLAHAAYSWYRGENPAGVAMYDPSSGRCFDGILAKDKVNRNSGAESTIEALLALEEMLSAVPGDARL
jgi:hypothetical protein